MGLQLMGRNNSAEKLSHYVRNLRPGVTEFMVCALLCDFSADRATMPAHANVNVLGIPLASGHTSDPSLFVPIAHSALVCPCQCHPGNPSTIGDEFSRSDERAHELKLLCDPALMRLLDSEQVRLGAWIDLGAE